MTNGFRKMTKVEQGRPISIHCTVLTFCVLSATVYMYLYTNLTFKTVALSTIIENALNNLERLNNNFKAHYINKTEVSQSSTSIYVDNTYFKAQYMNKTAFINTNGSISVDNTSVPLLVMFTTFSDKKETYLVRNNTLQNWISFGTLVKTVFFSDDLDLSKRVQAKGWDIMTPKTAIGIPILKYMYLDVMKKYSAKFYAYANGDLLFSNNLVDTLQSILKSTDVDQTNPFLIVGQRTNVFQVTKENAATHENIEKTAKKTGKLFTPWGVDYFITSANYPWDDCPDIVVGRIAYDNWLVLNANKKHHTTIDATKTLLAVHQTTKAGNSEGHHKTNKNYNGNLLGKLYKRINYESGLTSCTRKYTVYTNQTKIEIKNRKGC